MKERLITFTDGDENTLVVRLRDDRIQLAVVDSRPELIGDELRGFAIALFVTYAAAPLLEHLASARAQLVDLRGRLAKIPGGAALTASLDASLGSVAVVEAALSVPIVEAGASKRPAKYPDYTSIGERERRRRRAARRGRASEGPLIGWGWKRLPDDVTLADGSPA